jgi:RNA polymerase sigma factor (TIGR02999 family)
MASEDITTLLRAWGSGDAAVSDELFQTIYSQLRSLAKHHLRSRPGVTVTPTVLINEAFLALAADPKNDWRDRVQFFAFTATVMRRLMSAHARQRAAGKRGGGNGPEPFEESAYPVFDRGLDAAKLDDALTALEKLEPSQARIVELRFFGGLTVGEVATFLGVSERTVIRQWGLAKAWLAGELGAAEPVAPA